MKHKATLLLASLALVFSCGLIGGVHSNKDKVEETHASKSSYWDSWISSNSSALNTGGTTLVSALKSKITQVADGSSNTISYNGLWDAYKTSDAVPGSNGSKIWDMYGGFQFSYQSGGSSYSKEGDCYNREHSVPKSWFSEKTPAYSDLIHLVPTDGKVNGMRSNFAFGEVSSASYTWPFEAKSYNNVQYQNAGSSKLGTPKTILGVSSGRSTVFEPDDQYKGDFARIYMYFAVRYGGGTCSATSGDGGAIFSSSLTKENPYMTNYGLALMQKWHVQDPVSTKETNRNDAVETLQGNRNPFVDYPEWADKIFGTNYSSLLGPGVTISDSTKSVAQGSTFTLTATASDNSSITWTTSDFSIASVSNSGLVTGVQMGSATITATATISGQSYSATCAVTVTQPKSLSSIAVSNQKTSYVLDEAFVKPTVTATYSDSTTDNVTASATFSGFDNETEGEQTITVSYTEGNTTKTTTYTITVSASGSGGESGEEMSLDIDFTGSKSSDTDSEGNVWSTTGSFTTGSSYLRLNSSSTYISNSPELMVDTSETMSVSATLRTYGGVNSQSLRVTAFNDDDEEISNTVVLSPTDSTLREYSGTLTFTNSDDHAVTIKCYSGNNNSLGISGLSFTYTSWAESSKTLDEIEISTYPTKMSYNFGEYFDPTGLVITRSYSDSSSDTYTYAGHTSEFTFDPSTSTPLASGMETVEVTYGGQSCFFDIELTAPKALESIGVSGYTTNFIEGAAYVFGGTVTAYYADASSENVTTSSTFSGYDMTTVGNQTVTVSYGGKTTTYGITVSAGTLNSIAVSGQTTTYTRNASFSFDGTCTATFANGYQKVVTPTSVTSPDMSTAGNKTITVSYSYNGNTRQTTYQITVNSYRTVMEASEVSGTITWASSTATIAGSVTGLAAQTSGRTQYENQSMRLGTGSGGGTLTISATISITKLTISAKYYSSSYSSSVLKVDGQSLNSLTSSYKDYIVTLTSAKTSLSVLTESSSSRVNIQSVTVYANGPETDIGQSEDCVGLETFINTYMHMDYTENLGYCSDSEHHYYSTAKTAFNALNSHQRSLFTGNSAYTTEWTRLATWASKNGDSLNSSNQLAAGANPNVVSIIVGNSGNIVAIITVVALISAASIGGYFFIKKRKEI